MFRRKIPKQRLTVLLCSNMLGDFEKPLIIGNARNPRCFKGVRLENLNMTWQANKNAWMTTDIMIEWLKVLNRKIKNLNRKIILFLDHATCHPDIGLTNIQLSFLPPNTSSVCKPLDLGVIKAFKAQYRKKLLRHILANLDNASSSSELTKRVTVLDAVSRIISAQNAIEPAVVTKRFWKAGFGMASSSISLTSDEDVDTTFLNDLISRVTNDDITPNQFISFDDHVETSDTETGIARIVASRSIVDDEEEGELEIPEAYSKDVKNSVKSYQEFFR
jgi:hypothetical protein